VGVAEGVFAPLRAVLSPFRGCFWLFSGAFSLDSVLVGTRPGRSDLLNFFSWESSLPPSLGVLSVPSTACWRGAVDSWIAPLAPTSGEFWLFPRLTSGVGTATVGSKRLVVRCFFLSLSLPASRPCAGFGLCWLAPVPAALGVVLGAVGPFEFSRGLLSSPRFQLPSAESLSLAVSFSFCVLSIFS